MYAIERFGSITLSPFNNSFPLSPVPTRLNLTQTSAGVFDNDGEGRSKQVFPFALPYACVVAEDVYNNNRAVLDTLRAAVGTRARLYRRARNDSTVQWCMARLSEEPHDWPYTQRGYFEITLNFQQLSPWYGAQHGVGWVFDSGILLDTARTLDETPPVTINTSPKVVSAANGGNLPVTDIQFTVTAGSATITNIQILADIWHLIWSGTLLSGQSVTIDTGAAMVLKAGSDNYNALSFGVLHQIDRWARLVPGNNDVFVVLVGGSTNSTISIVFSDGWA